MSKAKFSDDFKRDAVCQLTERGYPVAEVSQRLGVWRWIIDEMTRNNDQRKPQLGPK